MCKGQLYLGETTNGTITCLKLASAHPRFGRRAAMRESAEVQPESKGARGC